MPFSRFHEDEFGVAGKHVFLTFGLLSPNKGINLPLARCRQSGQFPNIVYIVVGQTHPHLLRDEGEAYRLSLERLAKNQGVEARGLFNRFVGWRACGSSARRTFTSRPT